MEDGPLGSVLYLAASFSMSAALIHLWVAPEHMREWWGYGTFMLASAALQGLYAALLLRWPRRPILWLGIGGNLAIVSLYVLTRAVGTPLGPHAGHTEAVGGTDLLCTGSEVALILMLVVLMQNLYGVRVVLPAVLALGAALAVGGGFFAIDVLSAGPGPGRGTDGGYAVAQEIPTSFGSVVVDDSVTIPGPTAKQLSGVTHGIQSLVPPDKVQVQTDVTLTNELDHPVDYSPDQFVLVSGKNGKPAAATATSIRSGELRPGASIDASLSFLAPRNGSKLYVEYRDPNGEQTLIDLGRTGVTPGDALDNYHHHQ